MLSNQICFDKVIAYMIAWSWVMIAELDNPKNVTFRNLLKICIDYFGKPRIKGSHYIFKTPWKGDPRLNIQRDGKMAKHYQVKMVSNAIARLKENEKETD